MRRVTIVSSPESPVGEISCSGFKTEYHDLEDGSGWRNDSGILVPEEDQHLIEIAHISSRVESSESDRGMLLFDLWWDSKRLTENQLRSVLESVRRMLDETSGANLQLA